MTASTEVRASTGSELPIHVEDEKPKAVRLVRCAFQPQLRTEQAEKVGRRRSWG